MSLSSCFYSLRFRNQLFFYTQRVCFIPENATEKPPLSSFSLLLGCRSKNALVSLCICSNWHIACNQLSSNNSIKHFVLCYKIWARLSSPLAFGVVWSLTRIYISSAQPDSVWINILLLALALHVTHSTTIPAVDCNFAFLDSGTTLTPHSRRGSETIVNMSILPQVLLLWAAPIMSPLASSTMTTWSICLHVQHLVVSVRTRLHTFWFSSTRSIGSKSKNDGGFSLVLIVVRIGLYF